MRASDLRKEKLRPPHVDANSHPLCDVLGAHRIYARNPKPETLNPKPYRSALRLRPALWVSPHGRCRQPAQRESATKGLRA